MFWGYLAHMISFVEEWLGVFPLTHPVVEKIGFEIRPSEAGVLSYE